MVDVCGGVRDHTVGLQTNLSSKLFTGKGSSFHDFLKLFTGGHHEFPGFPNGLLARLGSASHPSFHLPPVCGVPMPPSTLPFHLHAGHVTGPSTTPTSPRRGPPLFAAALRPAHWPLGGGSNGSGVLPALLARLPLGLQVALDLSLVDLRRWPLFGHPPHAEVKEAPLPGRPVISGKQPNLTVKIKVI